MSRHQKTKQREAKERGDAARTNSQAYAIGTVATIQHAQWNNFRRKRARKAGLKSARELRKLAASLPEASRQIAAKLAAAALGVGATKPDAIR